MFCDGSSLYLQLVESFLSCLLFCVSQYSRTTFSLHASIMSLRSADCTGKTSLIAAGAESTLNSTGGMTVTPRDGLAWPHLSPAKKRVKECIGWGRGVFKMHLVFVYSN